MAVALSISATVGTAQASNAPVLDKIHHWVDVTHHYQNLTGNPKTPYYRWAEMPRCHRNCRLYIKGLWAKKAIKWYTLWEHIGTAVSYGGLPADVYNGLMCIHHYEGAWNSETGNGYHGGLQMDYSFETTYGPEFYRQYGHAGYWPPIDQLIAGYRAYKTRGYGPWPNTRLMCGI